MLVPSILFFYQDDGSYDSPVGVSDRGRKPARIFILHGFWTTEIATKLS